MHGYPFNFKGWLKTVTMRKINNFIGLLGPAVTVVLAGYAGCSSEWAIILFTASVGLSAFSVPGAKSRYIANISTYITDAISYPAISPTA